MEANKSGSLTEDQLFGNGVEVPVVCGDYLPLDVQQQLAERDAVKYTVCPVHQAPCSALDEHTGECLSSVCVFDLQQFSTEAV